jgi:hypothetical protein
MRQSGLGPTATAFRLWLLCAVLVTILTSAIAYVAIKAGLVLIRAVSLINRQRLLHTVPAMLQRLTYRDGDRCPHCDRALLRIAMRLPKKSQLGKSEVHLWCNFCNEVTVSVQDNRFLS